MTRIIRWRPAREMRDVREAMDRFFNRGVSRPWGALTLERSQGSFPIDLYETDGELVVKASLPGVKVEEVDVSVADAILTIKAERQEEQEENRTGYYRQEHRYGAFQRVLTLPAEVDADEADAKFEDGVLELRLPKAPDARTKTIEIKSGETNA